MSRALVGIVIVSLALIRSPTHGAPGAAIEAVRRAPVGGGGVPADHVEWMRTIIARASSELRLPRALLVTYRACGTANAYYHADTNAITICHELWDQRMALYRASGHDPEAIAETLRDAMAYTVFHELAHALHHELELPLVGRIEDTADELATLLLIRLDAYAIAAHAAYGHHLRSLQPGASHAFWDGHGSGAQRGFAIACLLHGADAARAAELVGGMHVPAAALAKCTHDHAHRLATWERLFGPHLRIKN